MSDTKGVVVVLMVIVLAFMVATSCQKIIQKENCVRDGRHEWVRVEGAQYECRELPG